jgi:hypothetical protein
MPALSLPNGSDVLPLAHHPHAPKNWTTKAPGELHSSMHPRFLIWLREAIITSAILLFFLAEAD